MQELKKEIAEKIAANRPKLSANSLKTYVSILSNIYKAMKGEGGVEFFSDNVNDIIKFMETKTIKPRKHHCQPYLFSQRKMDIGRL
jgi:hypothetical protein